ncbi:autophagy-related protein [Venturia nashicola]|nr:autophagy-related protein [Venturia nashicola]
MEEGKPQRRPRYAGEDTRPTSEKELRGWYSYGLGAEVFAVVGVGSFLPVTLEQLAREIGVLRSDGITPCINDASSQGAIKWRRDGEPTADACVVKLFGGTINTSSFAMYSFSIAVFFQAITLVSISAIADHGSHRKQILLILGYTGATACLLWLLVVPKLLLFGTLLVIISVACLGSSFVLLNSFLPLLVANHPSVSSTSTPTSTDGNPDSPGLTDPHEREGSVELSPGLEPPGLTTTLNGEKNTPEHTLSNQISSKGIGIGYAAAFIAQILSIGILLFCSKALHVESKTMPMRIILFVVGIWWALFTIPAALWLRQRPGPPLPASLSGKGRIYGLAWLSYISFAWKSLWKTIKIAVQLKQIVLFLIAWFLLSDAIATVSGTAVLFARTELHMSTTAIALVSITVMVSGILGAWTWPRISASFNLRSNQTILACILLFEIIPLYGLLGYLPFIKAWGVGGLQQPWEIFPLAVVHGFVMGGLSSFCRSFYGVLIPPGYEAAFYALYAVTDKGSSIVGPAIVGKIVDLTGTVRSGFWFLAILILLPLPFIAKVDSQRGKEDAVAMAKRLRGFAEQVEDREDEDEIEGLLGRERRSEE